MSLRIHNPAQRGLRGAAGNNVDPWSSRIAKLIPAEALGLYGAGQSVIPKDRPDGVWFLAIICLALSGWVRWF